MLLFNVIFLQINQHFLCIFLGGCPAYAGDIYACAKWFGFVEVRLFI